MNIDELTIGQLKQLQSIMGKADAHPWKVGKAYLIRTVTHYYTGRLVLVTEKELELEDVAWIADTGRFYDCLVKGELKEIEPFTANVIVGRGAIVDAVEWTKPLPREQK